MVRYACVRLIAGRRARRAKVSAFSSALCRARGLGSYDLALVHFVRQQQRSVSVHKHRWYPRKLQQSYGAATRTALNHIHPTACWRRWGSIQYEPIPSHWRHGRLRVELGGLPRLLAAARIRAKTLSPDSTGSR